MTPRIRTSGDDYLIAILGTDGLTANEIANKLGRAVEHTRRMLDHEFTRGTVQKENVPGSKLLMWTLTPSGLERAVKFGRPVVRTCPHCGGVL